MVNIALALAAAGRRVFPADPETRKPLIAWGEGATTDADTIRAWWAQQPDALPSIALGARDLVVDVDPRNGGDVTFDAMLAAHPELARVFAAAPRVQTARGGWHFYFQLPEGVSVKNGEWPRFGKGIDVKTKGGFVVAPGAVRTDGLRYGNLTHGTLVDAPAVIVADRRRDAKPEGVNDAPVIWAAGDTLEAAMVPGLAALLAPRLVGTGHRHDTARALGGALALAGWTDAGIADLVRALPSDDTAARVRDALAAADRARQGKETPQWGALERAGYAPGIVAAVRTMATGGKYDAAEAAAAATWATPTVNDWGGFEIDDIVCAIPPVPWLCEGLRIAPGPPTLLAGYGGIGKSMLAQQLALCVATGRAMFGMLAVCSGRVLHLDYEQGERECRTRYQRLAADMFRDEKDAAGILRGVLEVASPPPATLDADGMEAALIAKCTGFTLCVIDSLRAASPTLDENDSRIRVPLDMLWRVSKATGCTFVVIHHARKDSKNNGAGGNQNMRGNSSINDAAQTVIMCEPFADTELSGFNILCGKVRSGQKFAPVSVTLSDPVLERVSFLGLRFAVIDGKVQKSESEERDRQTTSDAICKTIAAATGGTFRGGQAALLALLPGIPQARVKTTLALLIGTGRVFHDKKEHVLRLVNK